MLFFELLQLALGNCERLSFTPTSKEWSKLYDESERQAVTGLILRGIDRLPKEQRPPQTLLLQWIGIGQLIEQQNRLLDERCVESLRIFKDAGLDGTILKGQGVVRLYDKELCPLRQSGDIDLYVNCGLRKTLVLAKSQGQNNIKWDYKHLHLNLWNDTEVEVHYRVEVLLNLWKNRKLQKWFKEHDVQVYGSRFMVDGYPVTTPTVEFNVFYILLHIYRHFLYEGVGFRQVIDYYFVLKQLTVESLELRDSSELKDSIAAVREFGMVRFAKGLMWVMHEALGMPREWMLWEPDEKEGRYILKQVMTGGNFGHHDKRVKHSGGKLGAVKAILTHNLHLLTHYPSDVIWAPVWIVWHKLWKLTRV